MSIAAFIGTLLLAAAASRGRGIWFECYGVRPRSVILHLLISYLSDR